MKLRFYRTDSFDFANAIHALHAVCNPQPWSDSIIRTQLKDGVTLVAQNNESLVGYLFARLIDSDLEIQDIGVSPDFRRNGIGKGLIKELLSQFVDTICYLEVRSKNISAIKLYESFGFINYGTRNDYYINPADDALMYKRDKTTSNLEV